MERDFNGVVFRINGIGCALDALEIREIVGGAQWQPLTMEGENGSYMQIRGKTARVVDLRETFGFTPATPEGLNSFIAVQAPDGDRNRLVALWVDSVMELLNVPWDRLRPLPPSFRELPAKFFRGMFEENSEPYYILSVRDILDAVLPDNLALKDIAS